MAKKFHDTDYLTIVELARLLGIRIADIKDWMTQPEFPFIRKDGKPYFRVADVFSWRTSPDRTSACFTINQIVKMKEMEVYKGNKIKNELLSGSLTAKSKENSRGYEVGRILRDKLTRVATLKGHTVRGAESDKAAENLLIEYLEEVFIEIKDLFGSTPEKIKDGDK